LRKFPSYIENLFNDKKTTNTLFSVTIIYLLLFTAICYYKGIETAVDIILIMSFFLLFPSLLVEMAFLIISRIKSKYVYNENRMILFFIATLFLLILNIYNFGLDIFIKVMTEFWMVFIFFPLYILLRIIFSIKQKR